MKRLFLTAMLALAAAGCMPLANVASPTNDPTLTNVLLTAGPIIAEYKAHGCVSPVTLAAIASAWCGPVTSANVTQQNAATTQCALAQFAIDLFPANKICPDAVPAPVPAPTPPTKKTSKLVPTPTRWDQIHQTS